MFVTEVATMRLLLNVLVDKARIYYHTPPSSRVCHHVYISSSKGGFPCCNSTRYHWRSESLHL